MNCFCFSFKIIIRNVQSDHTQIIFKTTNKHKGQECTDQEIKDIIDVADEYGTGMIDFPSFLKQFQHEDNEDPLEMVEEAFQLIGKGADITESEVKAFLSSIGQSIIDVEAEEIVKFLDKDGDGKVGLEDFKQIWTKQ